jgi:hypothetical protein
MTTPDIQETVKGARRGVDTFAPEPYRVTTLFTIELVGDGQDFIASWPEVNLHASGETQEQAFNDLKATVLDTFDQLELLGDDALGPVPRKQKNTLGEHVAKLED